VLKPPPITAWSHDKTASDLPSWDRHEFDQRIRVIWFKVMKVFGCTI
jgi:hypothetical protein